MSEMKHTPGPWKVYRNWRGKISVAANDGKRRICNVPTRTDGSGIQDARLIAAAPDLLEVLEELTAMLRKEAPGTSLNNRRFDALGIKCNAALAKAEGR